MEKVKQALFFLFRQTDISKTSWGRLVRKAGFGFIPPAGLGYRQKRKP
jgi:hypothetical protein